MNGNELKELRASLEAESISYGELALIENEFEGVPDSFLNEPRENATASDMLDTIEAYRESLLNDITALLEPAGNLLK